MTFSSRSIWFAAAGLMLAYAHAWGQGAGNVNECTLIQDPTELRNCILRFEGQRTPLPTTLESGAEANGQPIPAGDGSASSLVASPPPLTKVDKRRSLKLAAPSSKKVPSDAGSMPSQEGSQRPTKANSVWVEQIQIPTAR
jgi:hypothetical protein